MHSDMLIPLYVLFFCSAPSKSIPAWHIAQEGNKHQQILYKICHRGFQCWW